ncbi:voltage-gated potassium channel Kch [Nocardia tenerifensis]|uniref:Voltage-gated potassium channel Kch n=1 Tax=Nocardia tenerifensis TaxID=228006 RepID=A0A318JVB2_9NOCA|nr:NAD(P)-binding protein [Nocardia tenerifensis]PXX59685.1 voltage-gated potassium channel Kch [Nocardia tenerifensis]
MTAHSIVIGYGGTGRNAAHAIAEASPGSPLTVIDTDPARTALARNDGAHSILGDARDLDVLRCAGAGHALAVTIAVGADSEAVRITSAVRGLNNYATICTSLRAGGWKGVAEHLGADQVVVTSKLIGRLVGLSIRRPGLLTEFRRAMWTSPQWVVAERPVRANEIGHYPSDCGSLVLAVRRGDRLRWRVDLDTSLLSASDRLLVIRAAWPPPGRTTDPDQASRPPLD